MVKFGNVKFVNSTKEDFPSERVVTFRMEDFSDCRAEGNYYCNARLSINKPS